MSDTTQTAPEATQTTPQEAPEKLTAIDGSLWNNPRRAERPEVGQWIEVAFLNGGQWKARYTANGTLAGVGASWDSIHAWRPLP
jgi:hypothetical protein